LIVNDPKLALEFLNATKLPAGTAPPWEKAADIELTLQITQNLVANDPAAALATAEETLSKGISWNIGNVFSQLLQVDPPSAAKLADDIAQKITVDDILSDSAPASGIITNILSMAQQAQAQASVHTDTDIVTERMDNGITSRGTGRLTKPLPAEPFNKMFDLLANAVLSVEMTTNDQAQRNIMVSILNWMVSQDGIIQRYAPSKSDELQKRIAQYQQLSGSPKGKNLNQLMMTGTPDAIVSAAANAPASERNNYYFQASQKASNDGNLDLAVRIIDDNVKGDGARDQGFSNLASNFVNAGKIEQAESIANTKIQDPSNRNNIMLQANNRRFSDSVSQSKLDEAIALGARLPQQEQITRLIEISSSLLQRGKKDEAVRVIDRAWSMMPAKATNTVELQTQVSLVRAYGPVDPGKAAGYLQSIIAQVNDLLRAAEAMNGFDMNYFKDGELTMQGGTFQSIIRECGTAMATIASQDFETGKRLSEQFERPEARIMAQIMMASQLVPDARVSIRRSRVQLVYINR
jgi:hypothetical protein